MSESTATVMKGVRLDLLADVHTDTRRGTTAWMTRGRPSQKQLAPFGERLRSAIQSSPQFASRAEFLRHHGLEGATLYRYETGERSPPLPLLESFATSLGVRVSDLIETRIVDSSPMYPGIAAYLEAHPDLEPGYADAIRQLARSGGPDEITYEVVDGYVRGLRARDRSKARERPTVAENVVEEARGQRKLRR